ncbi:FGGY family carbohydrate kinase [Porticoccus sp. W117]|uniref:FGGY family carbohydrate kinase n=1 Tax=Porticoccus sp. W117 TaxID=3054777 RepID=UPI002593D5B1|nr:FGGY family carbohydrate kinase [Porticoccus sp. W117]MDM3871118.1 FGGY family carbohydrate kinase [Porticoccus sp. W117]
MYLVLDQGGQSSRAALFSESGELVHLHQQPVSTSTPTNTSRTGWVEQSPTEIIQSLRHCLAQINDASAIKSAALVTQRSSFLCWRKDTGEPLTPVISWQDTRGAQLLGALQLCPDEVRQRTGLFPNAHFGASKIAWCLRQVPAVAEALAQGQLYIAPLSTYILQQLTEEDSFLVDACNAQRTLLYNIAQEAWDTHLLQSFGVPADVLPGIGTGAEAWGHLRVQGHKVPVNLVSGDQNTAFIALGQGGSKTAVINAGTGAFIGVPTSDPQGIPQRLLQTILPDCGYIAEGTVNGAGRALATMAGQLECAMDNIAPLGEGDLLFLNGEGGLAAPYWQADFTSRFIGQGSAQQKLAAVQESIVFLLYRCFLETGALGEGIERLKVAGGLSQSDQFCQSVADLFQKVVIKPDVVEASAAGAAMLLAGNHQWPSAGTFFQPQSDNVPRLRFDRWQKALESALNG